MSKQRISSTDLRKYFTMLPNLYDDSDLDVYELRLLFHYARVGNCWESIQTTADKCKMGKAQIRTKRKSLAEKGLITMSEHPQHGTWDIEIVDKWKENMAIYGGIESDTPPPTISDSPPLPDSIPKEEPIKNNKLKKTQLKEVVVKPSVIKALFEAGISGRKIQQQLSSLDHMTPEYVKAHSEYAKRKKMGRGLLIHKMQSGDPMPKYGGHQRGCGCDECRKKYTASEFVES